MPGICSVEHVRNGTLRGVGFLIYPSNHSVTAHETFHGLSEEEQKYFRVSADYWVDGLICPRRFHGWNKSEFRGQYQRCFVFKQDEHRFYGFLLHPKDEERRYQYCLLASYAWKVQQNTEERYLRQCVELGDTAPIHGAVKSYFNESRGVKNGKR
jgi:hypothetical protein